MKIESTMNLQDLAERMGDVATTEDAARMRSVLVPEFDGEDTADVPEARWMELLAQ